MFFKFRHTHCRYFSAPFLQPSIVLILPSYLELFAAVAVVLVFSLYLFVLSIAPTYMSPPGMFGILHLCSPLLS